VKDGDKKEEKKEEKKEVKKDDKIDKAVTGRFAIVNPFDLKVPLVQDLSNKDEAAVRVYCPLTLSA